MLKTLCYVTRQVRGKGKKEGKGGGKEQTEREIENRGGVKHLAQYVAQ